MEQGSGESPQRTSQGGVIKKFEIKPPPESKGGISPDSGLKKVRSSDSAVVPPLSQTPQKTLEQLAQDNPSQNSQQELTQPLHSPQEQQLTPQQQAFETKYASQNAILQQYGVVGGFKEVRHGGNVPEALKILGMTLDELNKAVAEEEAVYPW